MVLGGWMSKKCPNCGKEILSDADFCGFCGVSLNDSKENFLKNKFSRKIIVFSILVIVVICFAAIGIISLVNTTSDDSPITVISCYPKFEPYFNETWIYVIGVANRDLGIENQMICADYGKIFTVNGTVIECAGSAEESVVKKGEKLHLAICPYERLNQTAEKITFNVTCLTEKDENINYGNVTAYVTNKK